MGSLARWSRSSASTRARAGCVEPGEGGGEPGRRAARRQTGAGQWGGRGGAVRRARRAPGATARALPGFAAAAVRRRAARAALVAGHATPGTRVRLGQALPNPNLVPTADRVAALCRPPAVAGTRPGTAWTCSPSCSVGWTPADWRADGHARRCMGTLAALDPRGTPSGPGRCWSGCCSARVGRSSTAAARTTDVVLSADMPARRRDQMAVVARCRPARWTSARVRNYWMPVARPALLPLPATEACSLCCGTAAGRAAAEDSTALHHALALSSSSRRWTRSGRIAARTDPEPRKRSRRGRADRQLTGSRGRQGAEHLRHEVLSSIRPAVPRRRPARVEHVARDPSETRRRPPWSGRARPCRAACRPRRLHVARATFRRRRCVATVPGCSAYGCTAPRGGRCSAALAALLDPVQLAFSSATPGRFRGSGI